MKISQRRILLEDYPYGCPECGIPMAWMTPGVEVDPLPDRNAVAKLEPEAMLQFRKGVAEFNAGRFFECHETLEDVWHGVRGSARDFFQGLIQVAVGFYHLGNRNLRGSRSQLEKGLQKLEQYGDQFMGIGLGQFRLQVATWLQKVVSGEEIGGHVRDLPKLQKYPMETLDYQDHEDREEE